MAQSGVVPSTAAEPDQSSIPVTTSHKCDHRPQEPESSYGSGRAIPTSHLASLGRSYHTQGLSEGVIDLMQKSWRRSTESAYSSAWRIWHSWCIEWSMDPYTAPVGAFLEFLFQQFTAGKQYRTTNSISSAVSMMHGEVDGVRVGQHHLVCRFLKGVYNSRYEQYYCRSHN